MSKYCYEHAWKAVLFLFNVNKKVLIEKIEKSISIYPSRREQCDEPFCKNGATVRLRTADTWEKRYKAKGAAIV